MLKRIVRIAVSVAVTVPLLAWADRASAEVTIQVTSPPPGQPVSNPVTMTVTYSSSGPALSLASLRVMVNGVDWTSRFDVGAGGASYVLADADQLVGGPLTIQAEIRDTANPPALGSVGESYQVLPTLQAVSPSAVPEGGSLTLGALGLDPNPDRDLVVFSSIFAGEAATPFVSVDREQNRGLADVPDGARTGPVFVRVNGNTSPQSLAVTVLPGYLECGGINRFHSLPNGSFLINYGNLRTPPPPGCPTLAPPLRAPLAVRLDPDGTVELLAISSVSGASYQHVMSVAVDKSGRFEAVLVLEHEPASTPVDELAIHYRGNTATVPLSGPIGWDRLDTDFDAEGNLLILLLDPRTHLLRISAAALAAGGEVVPELVADALDLRNSPGCADAINLAVSCDGHAYVGITNHYNTLVPPGVCPPEEWQRWNEGVIRKIDLATGSVVGDIMIDNGRMTDIALTCQADEILGLTLTSVNYPFPGELWRSVGGSVPAPVFPIPSWTAGRLTIGPTGKVYINYWEWQPPPIRYLLALPYRVGGCDTCASGESCPAVVAPQPYCQSTLLYPIRIRSETTRWRPQRSTSGAVEVRFEGPQGLKPETTLLITGPGGPLSGQALAFEVIDGQADPALYKITWTGPWQTGAPPASLPSGNYRVTVRGVMSDDSIVTSSPSDANGIVSLVEVASVEIAPVSGGAALDQNPAVPLHPDEPTADPSQARRARPGGGWRIFAEAPTAGEPVQSQVKVKVTIAPAVNREVPVSLRAIDVDDPDGAPIDKDNDSGTVNDNYRAGYLPASRITVPANATSAEALFEASGYPGDNSRVGASTSETWLTGLTAHQPSQVGEVRDANGATIVEGTLVSKMLTVWRTLHLEIDSMKPEPSAPAADERNFVNGEVVEIHPHPDLLTARRLTLTPTSPPGMNGLRDASADRDRTGSEYGDGRFEGGTIYLGARGAAEVVPNLQGNGIDYVEGSFLIYSEILGGDFRTLARGFVVSGRLDTGVFRFQHVAGSWAEAQKDAFFLQIGGVNWPIPQGGIGPLVRYPALGIAVGEVITGANRILPFRLRDDDRITASFDVNTDLLQDSDSPLTNAFAAAYIRPRRLPPAIDTRQASFNRNVACPPSGDGCDPWAEIIPVLLEGRDIAPPMSLDYWASYVQGAFQLGEKEDVDPDSEGPGSTLGVTVGLTSRFGSQVYTQHISELPFDEWRELCMQVTPVHELGHQFGREHVDSQGIMSDACHADTGRYFAAESLRRLREKGVRP